MREREQGLLCKKSFKCIIAECMNIFNCLFVADAISRRKKLFVSVQPK